MRDNSTSCIIWSALRNLRSKGLNKSFIRIEVKKALFTLPLWMSGLTHHSISAHHFPVFPFVSVLPKMSPCVAYLHHKDSAERRAAEIFYLCLHFGFALQRGPRWTPERIHCSCTAPACAASILHYAFSCRWHSVMVRTGMSRPGHESQENSQANRRDDIALGARTHI